MQMDYGEDRVPVDQGPRPPVEGFIYRSEWKTDLRKVSDTLDTGEGAGLER